MTPAPTPAPATRPLLEVNDLKKHFPIRSGFLSGISGYVYAVDGVSFSIAKGETLSLVVLDFGNPQAVVLGPLPDRARFERLGGSLERHELFPEGTNVEFAAVDDPGTVRILIWERGVGPTSSSGTGSCAALVASPAATSYESERIPTSIPVPSTS